MDDLVKFLKDIFMIKDSYPQNIGLSQFKTKTILEEPTPIKNIKTKDIKLSDLMRRN